MSWVSDSVLPNDSISGLMIFNVISPFYLASGFWNHGHVKANKKFSQLQEKNLK